jgi:hypothetical protein
VVGFTSIQPAYASISRVPAAERATASTPWPAIAGRLPTDQGVPDIDVPGASHRICRESNSGVREPFPAEKLLALLPRHWMCMRNSFPKTRYQIERSRCSTKPLRRLVPSHRDFVGIRSPGNWVDRNRVAVRRCRPVKRGPNFYDPRLSYLLERRAVAH